MNKSILPEDINPAEQKIICVVKHSFSRFLEYPDESTKVSIDKIKNDIKSNQFLEAQKYFPLDFFCMQEGRPHPHPSKEGFTKMEIRLNVYDIHHISILPSPR